MYARRCLEILRASATDVVAVSDAELPGLQQAWREIYAARLYQATGRWVKDGYDWHVFSFRHCPHLEGEQAIRAYRALDDDAFVVLNAEEPAEYGFRCRGQLPWLADQNLDVTVSALDGSWTMAFNHEDMGPYFSVRELATALGQPEPN